MFFFFFFSRHLRRSIMRRNYLIQRIEDGPRIDWAPRRESVVWVTPGDVGQWMLWPVTGSTIFTFSYTFAYHLTGKHALIHEDLVGRSSFIVTCESYMTLCSNLSGSCIPFPLVSSLTFSSTFPCFPSDTKVRPVRAWVLIVLSLIFSILFSGRTGSSKPKVVSFHSFQSITHRLRRMSNLKLGARG